MEKVNPYEKQVGGDHYKIMPTQPLYFARANNLKPEILKVIKYITRNKDREKDKDKACHILDLYVENQKLFPKSFISWLIAESKMSIDEFVHDNNEVLTWQQMRALYKLNDVIYCRDKNLAKHVEELKVLISYIG
jgi:hypothetical protein